jgi:hypothetical protein
MAASLWPPHGSWSRPPPVRRAAAGPSHLGIWNFVKFWRSLLHGDGNDIENLPFCSFDVSSCVTFVGIKFFCFPVFDNNLGALCCPLPKHFFDLHSRFLNRDI